MEAAPPNASACDAGFDRNVRILAEFCREVEYIHYNPVERGLVGEPQDWKRPERALVDGGTQERTRVRPSPRRSPLVGGVEGVCIMGGWPSNQATAPRHTDEAAKPATSVAQLGGRWCHPAFNLCPLL